MAKSNARILETINNEQVSNDAQVSNETITNEQVSEELQVHPVLLIPSQGATTNEDTFDVEAFKKQNGGTMTGAILKLHSEGLSTGAIAKKLNIRYQWVRNVLITPVQKRKNKA